MSRGGRSFNIPLSPNYWSTHWKTCSIIHYFALIVSSWCHNYFFCMISHNLSISHLLFHDGVEEPAWGFTSLYDEVGHSVTNLATTADHSSLSKIGQRYTHFSARVPPQMHVSFSNGSSLNSRKTPNWTFSSMIFLCTAMRGQQLTRINTSYVIQSFINSLVMKEIC